MVSKTETGHAKNVSNFEDLISFCTGYGTDYNPKQNRIKLTSLNTLHTNALDAAGETNKIVADARTIGRKIKGVRK